MRKNGLHIILNDELIERIENRLEKAERAKQFVSTVEFPEKFKDRANHPCWICKKTKKMNKGVPSRYPALSIVINNKRSMRNIYQLVWMLKKNNGNTEYEGCITHLCGNTSCINPEHLECRTHSENVQDIFVHNGKCAPKSKLNEQDIIQMRNDYANDYNYTQEMIADEYGISRYFVSDILRGACYPNVGGSLHKSKYDFDFDQSKTNKFNAAQIKQIRKWYERDEYKVSDICLLVAKKYKIECTHAAISRIVHYKRYKGVK